jgi:hypothetical protein
MTSPSGAAAPPPGGRARSKTNASSGMAIAGHVRGRFLIPRLLTDSRLRYLDSADR